MKHATITAVAVALIAAAAPTATAGTGTPAGLDVTGPTAATTINDGANIHGGTLTQRLADTTPAWRATADHALQLRYVSYTTPAGVKIPVPDAWLWYAQGADRNITAPTSGWDHLTASTAGDTADDTSDPGRLDLDPDAGLVHVTARFPGVYRFQFIDPGTQGGTDDDTVSEPITLTVLDVQAPGTLGATTSALTDDWRPKVTANTTVGVTKSLTAAVDLGGLTAVDARGTSGGVGVLRAAIARRVGIWHTSSATGDALDWDLRFAGTWPHVSYACLAAPCGGLVKAGAGAVDTAGRRVIPAVTDGIDTLRHPGSVVSTAVLDRYGNGVGAGNVVYADDEGSSTAVTQVAVNVPDVVTLSVSPTRCTGACTVTLTGVAEGASTVTVTGTGGWTGTAVVDSGVWSMERDINRSTTWQAATRDGASDRVTTTVQSTVRVVAVAGGKGRVVVDVAGGPVGGGEVTVKVSGRTGSCQARPSGMCRVVVTGVKKGKRSGSVVYDTPVTSRSVAARFTVAVK